MFAQRWEHDVKGYSSSIVHFCVYFFSSTINHQKYRDKRRLWKIVKNERSANSKSNITINEYEWNDSRTEKKCSHRDWYNFIIILHCDKEQKAHHMCHILPAAPFYLNGKEYYIVSQSSLSIIQYIQQKPCIKIGIIWSKNTQIELAIWVWCMNRPQLMQKIIIIINAKRKHSAQPFTTQHFANLDGTWSKVVISVPVAKNRASKTQLFELYSNLSLSVQSHIWCFVVYAACHVLLRDDHPFCGLM